MFEGKVQLHLVSAHADLVFFFLKWFRQASNNNFENKWQTMNINHVGRVSCFRITRFQWVGCLKTYYFWRPNLLIMSFSYFQTFSLVSISLVKQELFSLTWNFILSSRETHQDFLTSLYAVYAIVCFVKFTSAVKITLWIFRQIEGESMDASDERETRLFPDKGTQGRITCCALTAEFLIYATDVSGFQDFYVMPCHSLQNDGFMTNSRFTNKKVLAHMPVMSTKCGISTLSASQFLVGLLSLAFGALLWTGDMFGIAWRLQ